MSRRVVVFGLSITSSWGNGHATTYRGLLRELAARGADVLFVERNAPWYAANRDLPSPSFCEVALYSSTEELFDSPELLKGADCAIVGSYVAEGVAVGSWVRERMRGPVAFYDIDTPVTLAALAGGACEYLAPEQIPRYDQYLSFTGGPTLRRLESRYGSPAALPLYCSVDPDLYYPEERPIDYDLGYMGTFSEDRQGPLDGLMLEAARRRPEGRFLVAGPQYPEAIAWPRNVARRTHLPPSEHRAFYNAQRFTLNVTRAEMVLAGWSPSVRLFEAAACGVPIVSDAWPGLDEFFEIGREILVSRSADETLAHLKMSDPDRREIGSRARARVLSEHTAARRAETLEGYVESALNIRAIRA